MTDILFNELGAVVTQILGTTSCTIEPFYSSGPTYQPAKSYTVDFTQLLDNVLPPNAQYDTIVSPITGRRVAIGPHWPGGGYEGILCVSDKVVQGNNLLNTVWQEMGGNRYKYQVIASIADDNTIRRYHGFHAVVVVLNGETKLQIGKHQITYNQNDPKFYTGTAYNGGLVTDNPTPGQAGPVFVDLSALDTSGLDEELEKLPLSAGL